MPHADRTAATLGTTTRLISRRRATSMTCSPAAPPDATSVNPAGSTPRRPAPGGGRAPAKEVPRLEEAEDHVGVGDGRGGAAPAVAGGPRVRPRALRSHV